MGTSLCDRGNAAQRILLTARRSSFGSYDRIGVASGHGSTEAILSHSLWADVQILSFPHYNY